MPVLNYTTTISAEKTAAEIQKLLGQHGATYVVAQFTLGRPVGISFSLHGPHGDRAFTLPIDVAAMQKTLSREASQHRIQRRHATPEQAERTAWRVVKVWLAAQLALVETSMATLDQVMLPYLHVDGMTTLYQIYRVDEGKALPSGGTQS